MNEVPFLTHHAAMVAMSLGKSDKEKTKTYIELGWIHELAHGVQQHALTVLWYLLVVLCRTS